MFKTQNKQIKSWVGMATLLFSLLVPTNFAQTRSTAAGVANPTATTLAYGFRVGYTDGYQSGLLDARDNSPRDYATKEAYNRADRAYRQQIGDVNYFRDGYRQGFESGYGAGYQRSNFVAVIPSDLRYRGTTGNPGPTPTPGNEPPLTGVVMTADLLDRLSSATSRRGDTFEMRVVDPREYIGATVSGRVVESRKASKVNKRAELQLNFEQLKLPNGQRIPISGQVVEVLEARDNGVKSVDTEGGVRGKSPAKRAATRVGIGAGSGAAVGAVVGGGAGAIVGAVVGAAAGLGSVLIGTDKDIRLEPGQRLVVRTDVDPRVSSYPSSN